MNIRSTVVVMGLTIASTGSLSIAAVKPVRIEQTVEAQFPAALSFSPISSGEVRVMINVDAEGRLADLMVTGYTDKAFANEAVNLLRKWRYSPATVDGVAVGVRMELKFNFSSSGRVISLSAIDTVDALTKRIQGNPLLELTCRPGDLDQPVTLIHTINPAHPGITGQSPVHSGTTVVDFYVDESGNIRMPVVMETTDQNYAQAAVDALSQWRFSTPLRHGKPVAVRLQQKFVFPVGS